MRAFLNFMSVIAIASAIGFAVNAGCKQDMEKELRDPVQAAEACNGVGKSCYAKVSFHQGTKAAANLCRYVTSDACFNKLSATDTLAAGAKACRNVGTSCFLKENVFKTAVEAARICKGQ